MMQIVLLVILLNFVIALIGQYYEDVMNRRVMHTYKMKHDLNNEVYVFYEFLCNLGFAKDEKIDAIILIDGEKIEDELVWKGLTQTMKKVFVAELTGVKVEINEIQKQLLKDNDSKREELNRVSSAVNSINRKVELARDDNKK